MDTFFDVRLKLYDARKDYLIRKLTEEWEMLDNKVRFILAVVHGDLVVSNRRKADILKDLRDQGYKTFTVNKKRSEVSDSSSNEDNSDNGNEISSDDLDRGYDYLLSMKIWSLTLERVQALTNEKNLKRKELEMLMDKRPEDIWLNDLDELEHALDLFDANIEEGKRLERVAQRRANNNKLGKKKPKVKKTHGSDDDLSSEDFDDDDSYTGGSKANKKALKKKTLPEKKVSKIQAVSTERATTKKVAPLEKSSSVTLHKAASQPSKPLVQSKKLTRQPKKEKGQWRSDESDSELESCDESSSGSDESFSVEEKPKAANKKVPSKLKPSLTTDTIDLVSDNDDPATADSYRQKGEASKKAASSRRNAKPNAQAAQILSSSSMIVIDDDGTDRAPSKGKGGLMDRLQIKLKSEALKDAESTQRNTVFDFKGDSQDGHSGTVNQKSKAKVPKIFEPVGETKSKGMKRTENPILSPSISGERSNGPSKRPRKDAKIAKDLAPIHPKKSSRIEDSDEEDEFLIQPDNVNVKKSPKPLRARKPVNFSSYYESDNDEELDDDDSDF